MTSVLGGLGTVVASYLAHAKGTDKLEIYQKRVVDLEKFIRECEGFIKDYGDEKPGNFSTIQAGGGGGDSTTNQGQDKTQLWILLDDHIHELRAHYEMLLGNFDR